MKGLAVFVALSGALHLAALGLFGGQEGAEAAGDGGQALVSIEAADGTLTNLVAAWDRPPEVTDRSPDLRRVAGDPAPTPSNPVPVLDQPSLLPLARPDPASPPDSDPAFRAPELPAPPPAEPNAQPEPAKPAPPVSAARPGQTASGSGNGDASGRQAAAAAATVDPGRIESARAEWGASIRARIEGAKRAPRTRIEGAVRLKLRISPSGALVSSVVSRSSGHSELDAAALAAAARARFPAAPVTLGDRVQTFSITLEFRR